jgi:hypothetical protein
LFEDTQGSGTSFVWERSIAKETRSELRSPGKVAETDVPQHRYLQVRGRYPPATRVIVLDLVMASNFL